jgi:hypothetical protein
MDTCHRSNRREESPAGTPAESLVENLAESPVGKVAENQAGDLAESLAAKRTAPGQKRARTHSAHP